MQSMENRPAGEVVNSLGEEPPISSGSENGKIPYRPRGRPRRFDLAEMVPPARGVRINRNYAATEAPALIPHRALTIPAVFPVWNSSSLAENVMRGVSSFRNRSQKAAFPVHGEIVIRHSQGETHAVNFSEL